MAGPPIEWEEYNRLPLVREAHKILQDAGPDKWLERIAPILAEEDSEEKYAIFLVHRHHLLDEGERMVSNGLVTRPETNPGGNVIPSAWDVFGRPYEWTRLGPNDPFVPAPPDKLLSGLQELFEDLVNPGSVGSVMGISIRSPQLDEGNIWWERINNEKREHVIEQRPRPAELTRGLVRTSWIPKLLEDPVTMEWIMVWCCVCSHPSIAETETVAGKN